MVASASGAPVLVDNMAEIQEAVPFDIVLPENLPLDLQITLVSVQLPPAILDQQAKDKNIKLLLTFRSQSKTVGFQLTESLAALSMGASGVQSTSNGGAPVNIYIDQEREYVAATWEGCGLGFLLTGGPPDQLTEAKVLEIVDATLQTCE